VPVRPKTLINQLRPTLPAKYAPLTKDGNGLQSVYLAAIPVPMAGVLMQASPELDNASKTVAFEMENEPVRRVEDQVEAAIRNDTTIDSTEKHELVLARRGQGKFVEANSRVKNKTPPGDRGPTGFCAPWRRHVANRAHGRTILAAPKEVS